MNKGYIYLLHFRESYKHARHYMGFSEEHPEKDGGRIDQHHQGKGSRLTSVFYQNQIDFEVAWIREGDRNEERRLKNMGGASRICPICKQLKTSKP